MRCQIARHYTPALTAAASRNASVFAEAGRHPVEQLVSFAVSDADEPTAEGTRRRMPGQLTFREAEIADLAARGMSNRQIAEHLFISKRTVDAHLDHIYAKLDISSRVELLYALQLTRPSQPRATGGEWPGPVTPWARRAGNPPSA